MSTLAESVRGEERYVFYNISESGGDNIPRRNKTLEDAIENARRCGLHKVAVWKEDAEGTKSRLVYVGPTIKAIFFKDE